jgi:RNA polymerase sigma-70 factor (ECF subfamily)
MGSSSALLEHVVMTHQRAPKPSANQAMGRYARGDDTAFAEVYDYVAPRLHGFLSRRTASAHAEDVLQHTFLRMHASRARFARGAEVIPWVYAIARRLLIDGYREGSRNPTADEGDIQAEPADPAASPCSLVSKRRLLRRLEAEIDRVSPTNRVAFELVKVDGISMSKAAQILGTTELAVKLRVHRARQALTMTLGPDVREELAGRA